MPMTTTHERMMSREAADLVMRNMERWGDVECPDCCAVGRHHVRLNDAYNAHFLHCRRCGEELMEVTL